MVSALTDHLGYLLRQLSNHVSQGFAQNLAAEGVTVAEWVFMRELYDEEALPSVRLAERLGMTRGAITKLGDRLTGTIQIISADEKRFRSFVRIMKGDECVATIEQLCLHVNMAEGKSAPASAEVWQKLKAIAAAHAALPLPEGAGRAVGQKK